MYDVAYPYSEPTLCFLIRTASIFVLPAMHILSPTQYIIMWDHHLPGTLHFPKPGTLSTLTPTHIHTVHTRSVYELLPFPLLLPTGAAHLSRRCLLEGFWWDLIGTGFTLCMEGLPYWRTHAPRFCTLVFHCIGVLYP